MERRRSRRAGMLLLISHFRLAIFVRRPFTSPVFQMLTSKGTNAGRRRDGLTLSRRHSPAETLRIYPNSRRGSKRTSVRPLFGQEFQEQASNIPRVIRCGMEPSVEVQSALGEHGF